MFLPSARTRRPSSNRVHAGVQDGGDVLFLQEHRQQAFPVRQPADSEVAQERLRGHIGQLYLPLQPRLAQPVGHVEQVLVGGAEAPGALARTHHDVGGIIEEPPPPLPGVDRVVQGGDRVRVAVWAEPGHHPEVVAVTGGDDQVVIAVDAAGRGDLLGGQVDPGGLGVGEIDPVSLERRREREGDVGGAALAERQPDQRRVEQEVVRRGDHPDIHVAVQLVADRERCGQPAEIPPQYEYLLAAALMATSLISAGQTTRHDATYPRGYGLGRVVGPAMECRSSASTARGARSDGQRTAQSKARARGWPGRQPGWASPGTATARGSLIRKLRVRSSPGAASRFVGDPHCRRLEELAGYRPGRSVSSGRRSGRLFRGRAWLLPGPVS